MKEIIGIFKDIIRTARMAFSTFQNMNSTEKLTEQNP